MTKRKAVVIFSGYNQRALIAFLRYATEHGLKFYIIASSEEDPILMSKYGQYVFSIRTHKAFSPEIILPILVKLKEEKNLDELVILPSSEYLNRAVLASREEFLEEGISIPLVGESIYQKISDKYAFRDLCDKSGLTVPKVYENTDVLVPPYVLKPRKYFSPDGAVQFKPQLILTQDQHLRFVDEHTSDDFYIEEFVQGRSFYLLFYISRDGSVISYSQENLIQQADGGSMIVACSANLHDSELSDRYSKLLVDIGFHGLIMIELRKSDSEVYMIEANPRLWGPSQLFVDSKVPLFSRFLGDLEFELPSIESPDSVKPALYFWSGGMGATGLGNSNLVYHGTSPERMKADLHSFAQYDIYNRPDTLPIYELENTHNQR